MLSAFSTSSNTMSILRNPKLLFFTRIGQFIFAIAFLVLVSWCGTHRGYWNSGVTGPIALGGTRTKGAYIRIQLLTWCYSGRYALHIRHYRAWYLDILKEESFCWSWKGLHLWSPYCGIHNDPDVDWNRNTYAPPQGTGMLSTRFRDDFVLLLIPSSGPFRLDYRLSSLCVLGCMHCIHIC